MKILSFLSFMLFLAPQTWLGDFNEAKKEAKQDHKTILINFSGSDWCGPCIRMKKEIYSSEQFNTYAEQNLVLVRADFPRAKKNQLPDEQVKKNEQLAEKYNKDGKFPLSVLVDEDGRVIKEWEGYPAEGLDKFISEIDNARNGRK